ncbi:MAG: TraB/GumN family protein [Gloeobacteraceae cyanobacterium ES-bin-316]|nr:TraB/GumN family protein [Ferruginibacter sp.]
MAKLNDNYSSFTQTAGNDYLTETSFRINNYENSLKSALSTEPPVVNSLLYRSYKTRDDFEEDTFLDLYIFQAGRKLGKEASGVEDYYESEKLVMEAYRDMANEKKRKDNDLDGETMGSMLQKLQQAYRYGDLDLMDSLDNILEKSPAFREKFLFKRNEIQANSIDSILKTKSLFAGVGAAHLPGDRGIIELLRKKGYHLRAVKMTDRDAEQKEAINQLKVPVTFSNQKAEDLFYSVDVPGTLYSLQNSYQEMDRSQYADMSNGAYYLVTRVKTYASFISQQAVVNKKVDSLLYEYIPGTILSKKTISKNGYAGFDINNRTRRGDLQRYQIFITPFEVIIFKMSGKADYVNGAEANQFFNSIRLKEYSTGPATFSPAQGGFSILLPHEPHSFYNSANDNRWEYEAVDKTTGDAYLLLKRSVYNYNFLESDSFDLALIETSFRSSEYFEKQISRKYATLGGYPALLVKEKLKDGNFVQAAYVLQGPHYYVIAHRSKNSAGKEVAFYKSLQFVPNVYPVAQPYNDSFLLIKTKSPVQPEIDNGIRSIIEQTADDAANGNNSTGYFSYWKKVKNGLFKSKATGEMVSVQMQEYPKYFFIRDSAKFWKDEMADFLGKDDLVLYDKKWLSNKDGSVGYHVQIRDTGSSRSIERLMMLKGKYMFTLSTLRDTLTKKSSFLSNVFENFVPHENVKSQNLYENKLSLFFSDLFSADSALHKKAQQSISNIYFGSDGAAALYSAINRLSVKDKDYFDSKSKLISELGYVKDSVNNAVPGYLKKIYEQTADTSLFQNEAIMALARGKTTQSFAVLKELVLADPPIFEDDNDYDIFFDYLADSLPLSKTLFPQILQLSSLNDYKENINSMLVSLVDSGYIKGTDYADYFSGIYIDAKVAWKKQQAREEKIMEANSKKDPEDEEDEAEDYAGSGNSYVLNDQAVLLMPFYDSNKNIPPFFARLLKSKDDLVRMNVATLMLRNKKEVPDSILAQLAANDKQRGSLFYKLERAGRLDKFPAAYKNQLALARSYMVMQNERTMMDSVVFIKKNMTTIRGKAGQLYFFKYRVKKTDDWKIGISGLQPYPEKELSSNDNLASLTDKKLLTTEPVDDQLNQQLKKLIFPFYNSGKNFFKNDRDYQYNGYSGDYESIRLYLAPVK